MTDSKVLSPKEYAKHLKDYCNLTEQEVEIVLKNVYKREKQEKEIEKTYKRQKR